MPFAIILSILVHVGLVSILATGGKDKGGKQGKQKDPIKMTLIDKPQISESKNTKEIPPEKSKVKVKKLPLEQIVVNHECDDFYTGIGITNMGGSCIVGHVAKGYPADRAGILVGDLILTNEVECPGRGPIGTLITLTIMRGTQVFTKTIVREKICISVEKPIK